MQKFDRTAGPVFTTEDEELENISNYLLLMTDNHCAFCGVLIPQGSHNHVEHLKPKSMTHLTFEWENIYPCCAICASAKRNKYDEKLLRPDALDFDFDRYFDIDWRNGDLAPNDMAQVPDQQSAQITIDTFQLNGFGRPEDRLKALEAFEVDFYQNKKIDLLTYSYPFFLERALLRTSTTFTDIQITGLRVKNIKCFNELDIPINRQENSTLIIGTNSRGKTTLLQLIAIGLTGLEQVPLENCWQDVVRKGEALGEFEIRLVNDNVPVTVKFRIDSDDSVTCIQGKEQLKTLKNCIVLGYGVNRAIPNSQTRPNAKFEPIATLFGENAHIKNIQQSETFQYLQHHFATIKALTNEVFAASSLHEAVSLEDFDARSFYFKTYSNPAGGIPLGAVSEGFKATFVWLFDLMIRLVEAGGNIHKRREISGIILIDEIDLHLHPVWQRTILPSLESIFPKLQFIVTTHSMLVGQSVAGQCLIKLTSDEQGSVQLDQEIGAITSQMSFSEVGREIFDIKSPYNQQTEKQLALFYQKRDEILLGKTLDINEFTSLFTDIAAKGPELSELIHQELMQLELETEQRFIP